MTLTWWEVFIVMIALVVIGGVIGAAWGIDYIRRGRWW